MARHHVRAAKTSDLIVWEKFFNTSALRVAYTGLIEEIREELISRHQTVHGAMCPHCCAAHGPHDWFCPDWEPESAK